MFHDLNRDCSEAPRAPGVDPELEQPFTYERTETLRRAVAKLVLLGERAGVSVDQMILLLDSGLSVSELLDYVADRCEPS